MSIAQNFPEIKPSLNLDFANTKKLDDRVTFARASEARYYDGVTTAKAEENLVLYSQEFENAAWLLSGASRTANSTTAPDGTNTADKLIEDSSTSVHAIYQAKTVIATTHTASVYMKESERSWGFLQFSTGQLGAYFDLTNGVVGTVSAGFTASIQSVNNGWYRCSITTTTTSASWTFAVLTATGDGVISYTGDGTSGIFIWGAQLEQRSSVTAYTPTTTQPITNYIPTLLSAPANTARFDHNPVTGESLGLLVEEQRTNLLLRSEEFDNAAWTKTRASITSNTIVAPDGTLTGDKWVEDTTASNTHTLVQNVTINNATVYSFSFYAKAAERSLIRVNSPSIGVDLWFNLATGLLQITTLGTGTITPVGNGWYRIVATGTSNTTSGAATIFLSNGTTHIYTGDGYSGVYIWGAQLEAGAFPTSYIKTEASQVTRSADNASMTGANFSDWYRADEGTVYTDSITYGGNGPIAYLTDNTLNNLHQINANFGGSYQFTAYVVTNGVNVVNFNSAPLTYGTNFKIGYGFKTNDFGASVNGASVSTDTSGTLPIINRLDIGRRFDGSYVASAVIKKIAYYPARLTNTQLQALTS